jgi:hypothetical protein
MALEIHGQICSASLTLYQYLEVISLAEIKEAKKTMRSAASVTCHLPRRQWSIQQRARIHNDHEVDFYYASARGTTK